MFIINEGKIVRPTYGGLNSTKSGIFLSLNGEIIIDTGEYNSLMNVVKVRSKLPVDKPFESWEDLINAVKEDTPQADKIIRYLEEWGYHDVLKRKKEILLPDKKTTAYEWVNFILTQDETDSKNVENIRKAKAAQEFKDIPPNPKDGIDERTPRNKYLKQFVFDNPADYNRKMYQELLKYAPRTLAQTVQLHPGFPGVAPSIIFGGRLLKTGGVSPHDIKRKIEPIADYIVKSNRDDAFNELDDIFSVIPDDWKIAALGDEFKNVRYAKDSRAEQLQPPLETLNAKDTAELERLRRTYEILIKRSETATDKEAYYIAIKDLEVRMKAISDKGDTKGLSVFIKMAVCLDDFMNKLSEEVKDTVPREAGGLKSIQTSLTGINKLISLLDPIKAETETKYAMKPVYKTGDEDPDISMTPKGRKVSVSGGSMGVKKDLFSLFEDVIGEAIGMELHITRMNDKGSIFFTTPEHEREYVDIEPGDIETGINPQDVE